MDFNTMWGEIPKQDEPEKKEEILEDDPKLDDEGNPVEPEVEKEEDPKETEPEKKEEELKKTETSEKTEDEPAFSEGIVDVFDNIVTVLEDEELLLPSDKEYEPTQEGFAEMMKDNMEAQQKKFDDEQAKREAEIHESYKNAGKPKIADIDISDDSNKERLVRDYLAKMDTPDDEIEEKIKEAKELDSLDKDAKIAKRFLAKEEAAEEAKISKAKTDEESARQKQVDDFISDTKTQINGLDEFVGFKMTSKIKTGFSDYLFKRDKDGNTAAQKANTDPDRRLRLAFMDYMDYNKKDFEIKAKTEVSDNLKKKTSRFTSKQSSAKGASIEVLEEQDGGFKPGFIPDFFGSPSKD